MVTSGSVNTAHATGTATSSTPQLGDISTECCLHGQQQHGECSHDGDEHNLLLQQGDTLQYQHCYYSHGTVLGEFLDDDDGRPSKLSRFFHSLSNKLKFGRGSGADSREALLRDLGFSLDFAAVVQQPPLRVLDSGAACMQRLNRMRKVFVLSKDDVKGIGSVVRIEVTLTPPSATMTTTSQGIFHPNTAPKIFLLTRPFKECRKLRKVILYLVGRERQRQQEQCQPRSRSASVTTGSTTSRTIDSDIDDRASVGGQLTKRKTHAACPFCARAVRYTQWCWEQPPLLATNVLSGLALFNKIVLTNSLMDFIHMARSPHAGLTTSFDATLDTTAAATQSVSVAVNSDQQQPVQTLASVPFCEAQAELAILLHDFFQLSQHV